MREGEWLQMGVSKGIAAGISKGLGLRHQGSAVLGNGGTGLRAWLKLGRGWVVRVRQ